MTQFLVAIIVIAVLFAIIKVIVPIDARVQQIVWLVIVGVVTVWAVKFLVPLIA